MHASREACAGSHTTKRTHRDELVRRGSLGKRALIAGGRKLFSWARSTTIRGATPLYFL